MKETEKQITDIIKDYRKELGDFFIKGRESINRDNNITDKILSEVTIEVECPECDGEKKIVIGWRIIKCPICHGTGKETITLKEAIARLQKPGQ